MSNDDENPPEILYKYRAVDKFTLFNLINNTIWFAKPVDLNDPFDCQLPGADQSLDEVYIKDFIKEWKKVGYNEKKTRAVLDHITQTITGLKERIGVLSLSSLNDQALMWSHYAEQHQGICIGYKSSSIKQSTGDGDPFSVKVVNKDASQVGFDMFNAVHQFCNYEVNKELRDSGLDPDKKVFTEVINLVKTKLEGWKYEDEWRYINRSFGIRTLDVNSIASIHFGLRCPEIDRQTVRKILHRQNIKFYKMVRASGRLGLEAVHMNAG